MADGCSRDVLAVAELRERRNGSVGSRHGEPSDTRGDHEAREEQEGVE